VHGEDKVRFRGRKATRDATGMLSIMSEQTLNRDEEICACFKDWQKTSEHVKWKKLMQILNKTGIDWHKRRLISKLYMDQSIKVQLEEAEEGLGRSVVSHRFYSTYRASTLQRELFQHLETSK
jgi:hypothetical protein